MGAQEQLAALSTNALHLTVDVDPRRHGRGRRARIGGGARHHRSPGVGSHRRAAHLPVTGSCAPTNRQPAGRHPGAAASQSADRPTERTGWFCGAVSHGQPPWPRTTRGRSRQGGPCSALRCRNRANPRRAWSVKRRRVRPRQRLRGSDADGLLGVVLRRLRKLRCMVSGVPKPQVLATCSTVRSVVSSSRHADSRRTAST